MSSNPQQRTSSTPSEAGAPYASYAQIVRMLLPLTGKVSFYDEHGQALWISDGLEEPELRMHVEILLSRCSHEAPGQTHVDDGASEFALPTYVFPIRNPNGALVGAMAIVFRDVPANATYRGTDMVERLLAPLLDVLSHGWRTRAEAASPVTASVVDRPVPPLLTDSVEGPTPLPALLRRTLALATHRLQCAFGAVVMSEPSFTLTHRASPDESDLTMNAAIDTLRGPTLKLMQLRDEPLIVNGPSGRDQSTPYKFLVFALPPRSERAPTLMMMFRRKHERDFTSRDAAELVQIAARLSPPVLTDEAPTRTMVARPASSSRPIPWVITPDAAPTMEARIRAALRDDGFDLYAQRISPLRNERRPARFEVLLRMQDSNQLRAPASFFEAAEASTLMPELDRWVIRRLLATLKEHAALVRSGRWEFCINVAAQSLNADGFDEFIVAEVCKSSIPAGLLVFEVAESDALEHRLALELLGARLRDVGCRIALDNCRVGLATFGAMHQWPVSCVKFDGSLIGKLRSHARSEAIVRAMTQLASSMGIETVAERVESAEIRDKLIDIGVDYAQGFHLEEPRPLTAVFQ